MMTRRSLLASSLLAPILRAQEAVFTTDVNVVNVLATVRDNKGRIVTSLTKEDFALEEDGRAQEIRYFAQQSDLPLIIGLVVDTSPSVQRVLADERKVCQRFLERVLRPDKDQAFLIQFSREVELLQDLTSSREELEKAIELLKGPERELRRRNDFQFPGGQFPIPGGGRFPVPRGGGRNPRGGGPTMGGGTRIAGTALYDAVLLASEELMLKQKGRKAIILITDGIDAGSKVSMEDGIEAAQHADTLIYSIRFFDEAAYRTLQRRFPGAPDAREGKKILEQISRETGGAEFDADKKLDDVFERIEEELRNQYSLGYKPDKPGGKGEFREIRLTTPKKGLTVRTRKGYYA